MHSLFHIWEYASIQSIMEDLNSYILGTLYTILPNIVIKIDKETFDKYTITVIIFLRQTIVSKLKLHHSVYISFSPPFSSLCTLT